MKYIKANTAFQVSGIIFGLQPKTSSDTTKLQISIDNVTFTDAPNGTITGTTIFDSFPAGLWLKCDKDIYCTENVIQANGINMVTVTGSSSKGKILFTNVSTNEIKEDQITVPEGTRIRAELVNYYDQDGLVFGSWSTGATLNPFVFVADETFTLTANLVPIE